ncbi:amidohydrolase family protein [Novosphingobium sp. KCTC 2891]|uniref:N-acyl-D-amino-acid deacylase family protein n=1 Tax=Novosphingobium sp. KCTC 2891 TaxID=2989730 RepID=UPI002222F999|nr:amidohydrolase family protein [Novosphingobium sp. KCTC 2891]MCW1385028.1 amidohydrolase family protein [Novosphingobium sp. KCTC 2891]
MPEELYDIVLRQGTVVDGLGGTPFVADVAVRDGKIVAVGTVDGSGTEEIDARGLLVTPGFVDVHTHYDAQVIWESTLSPSSNHGVTTVLMGNCGVGFAPCRPEDRQRLIQLMEGVEDIPGVVMAEGLTWEWESYPQYLDAVAARPHDINVASYLPHAPLRVYVMGERAAAGEKSTPEDRARMAEIAGAAMRAGALGFSTSRSLFHKSSSGEKICTLDADEAELSEIAAQVRDNGDGILQVAVDFGGAQNLPEEFALLERVARSADRVMTMPIAEMHKDPNKWREIMDLVSRANASGARMGAQSLPRGIGMLFGLELSAHPFFLKPSYREIAHLPIQERLGRMRDPEVRARILSEASIAYPLPVADTLDLFDGMYEVTNPLNYEPLPETSLAARAQALGITAEALAYDLLLSHDGQAAIFLPFANYAKGNLDAALEMLRHPDIVLGLGDGGAHYGIICDASYSTFLLSYWTRDRVRGERIGIPEAIRALTHDTASLIGLNDRGVVAPGYNADLNVIDYDNLRLEAPGIAFDLPEGGRRLTQRSQGYVATIINGEIVYRNGLPTGALPGKLARGRKAAPRLEDARLMEAADA